MSKAAVTAAIIDYLDPLNSGISYLGKVYSALPKVGNEQDLFNISPPGTGIGAVIYCFIEGQRERRIADAGDSGQKMRAYTLAMLCIFKSDLPDPVDGQNAFNDFIDSLTAAIEADRTANSAGVIFQWGEGNTLGGTDLAFDFPVPKSANGGVMLFQAVGRVTVLEVLNT